MPEVNLLARTPSYFWGILGGLLAAATTANGAAPPAVRVSREARQLLTAAIRAHGGHEKLKRMDVIHMRGRYTRVMKSGVTIRGKGEAWYSLPDRTRTVLNHEHPLEARGTVIVVLANRHSWLKYMDMAAVKNSESEHRNLRLGVTITYITLLYPLLDRSRPLGRVTTLPSVKENGRSLVCLCVRISGGGEVDLYFDENSFLLVKRVWRYPVTSGVTDTCR